MEIHTNKRGINSHRHYSQQLFSLGSFQKTDLLGNTILASLLDIVTRSFDVCIRQIGHLGNPLSKWILGTGRKDRKKDTLKKVINLKLIHSRRCLLDSLSGNPCNAAYVNSLDIIASLRCDKLMVLKWSARRYQCVLLHKSRGFFPASHSPGSVITAEKTGFGIHIRCRHFDGNVGLL